MGGTGLAAVAAIGGLWAQAVTTYWSQQAAKDQLQQSRDDSENEERGQAKAVSVWVDGTLSSWRLHILNRSPDPVPELTVVFDGRLKFEADKDPDLDTGPVTRFYAGTSRLAPCTELIFTPKAVDRVWNVADGSLGGAVRASTFGELRYSLFVDRDGRRWQRGADGLLTSHVPSEDIGPPPEVNWTAPLDDVPEVKKAASCREND
ncbi:hypothetical protein G9272_41035 [Streptomyces asoensis]|uniref:Uncharacterized protein n=1 Tax=Streptomyces asoensis TaxID=249586 RepID=A0A6M4WZY4_9ACTN|nr:hypothetical protein [Streptomyces asoensis]QJT05928.1 hypothetical protein G9272_41035 [Streptomyces asoensis]